ncbi:hypothetical protein CARN8_1010010 [mine drainage metagenome]|uniref:Uncharacterized protein n=1 Tax=mine drainage metagenome TaxID=410659 RepID=A0A3P3ZL62_9ZZZZ
MQFHRTLTERDRIPRDSRGDICTNVLPPSRYHAQTHAEEWHRERIESKWDKNDKNGPEKGLSRVDTSG